MKDNIVGDSSGGLEDTKRGLDDQKDHLLCQQLPLAAFWCEGIIETYY